MYVCICNSVTEADVHQAVQQGVRRMRELVMQTGCSSQCGRCARTAVEVLDEALGQQGPFLRVVRSNQAA